MSAVLLSARCVLAIVFAAAAVGKLLDLQGSGQALEDFGVSPSLAGIGGSVLPIGELLVASLLLIRPLAVGGAVGAFLLLLVFIAGISNAMRHDRTPDCHCFGQLHSEPAGPHTLVRNALLAALALFVGLAGPGPSLEGGLGSLRGAQIALVATAAFAAALAVLALQLWSDRRRLLREVERLSAAKVPPGLPSGSRAPDFELHAVSGDHRTLSDLLRASTPVALVFMSTSCGPCLGMLPLLAGWQASLSEAVIIPAIISGELSEVEGLVERHELELALTEAGAGAFASYALRATPSAVLVDPSGTIAATVAEGVPAIEALIRSTVAAGPRVSLVQ